MDELNSRAQSVLMYGNAPGWKLVTSSVPDNPILGLILFSSFNSNTYAGFECILGKLADDVKWGGAIESLDEEESLAERLAVALGDCHAAWTASQKR